MFYIVTFSKDLRPLRFINAKSLADVDKTSTALINIGFSNEILIGRFGHFEVYKKTGNRRPMSIAAAKKESFNSAVITWQEARLESIKKISIKI